MSSVFWMTLGIYFFMLLNIKLSNEQVIPATLYTMRDNQKKVNGMIEIFLS